MRQTYIVSYDLAQPGQSYEELLQKIKSYGSWARLGGSAYIIITTETPTEIRDKLKTSLDINDKLFIGKLSTPAAWVGLSDQISKWIINHLK